MAPPKVSANEKHIPSQSCNLSTPEQQSATLGLHSVQMPCCTIATTTVSKDERQTTRATSAAVYVQEHLEIPCDISTLDLPYCAADCAIRDDPDTTTTPEHTSNSMSSNCRLAKRHVHFPQDSKLSSVRRIVVWSFAYQAARKGPWEQFARDRAHFKRRIECVASVLEPCLAARRVATKSSNVSKC